MLPLDLSSIPLHTPLKLNPCTSPNTPLKSQPLQVTTQYHYILLYADKVTAVSYISGKVVSELPLTGQSASSWLLGTCCVGSGGHLGICGQVLGRGCRTLLPAVAGVQVTSWPQSP